MSGNTPPYAARVVERIDAGPGRWGHVRVGVFAGDARVGEYVRNYPEVVASTFFPFELAGAWYALYSPDYTATRVMRLPDCTDLGGEEPHAHGFCPVEYLVPRVTGLAVDPADPRPRGPNHDAAAWAVEAPLPGGGTRYFWPDDPAHPSPDPDKKAAYLAAKARAAALFDAWLTRTPVVTRYTPWGFVAGCVWGDDSSWKVQFLDLSRAAEGVVTRDARFGHLELPAGVPLADAVHVEDPDDLNDPATDWRIAVASPTWFSLTGKRL